LALFSPQNVDRLVSFYKAAVRDGRTLVLDPYSAFILHLINRECRVPDPFSAQSIRILLPDTFANGHAGRRLRSLLPQMKASAISLEQIKDKPRKILLVFREWMHEAFFDRVLPRGSRIVYSYWPGYLEGEALKRFRATVTQAGADFDLVHASGHIHPSDLEAFVDGCRPKTLFPMHSTMPERMAALFPILAVNVRDGVPYIL
jgi:ribonuclease J